MSHSLTGLLQPGAYRYQPLINTVMSLFMRSTDAYLGLVDLDEFLLITRPSMTVQQLLSSSDCAGCVAFGPVAPSIDENSLIHISAQVLLRFH